MNKNNKNNKKIQYNNSYGVLSGTVVEVFLIGKDTLRVIFKIGENSKGKSITQSVRFFGEALNELLFKSTDGMHDFDGQNLNQETRNKIRETIIGLNFLVKYFISVVHKDQKFSYNESVAEECDFIPNNVEVNIPDTITNCYNSIEFD